VKNSSEFAQQVSEIETQEGETMISFNVVSLFTKVPVDCKKKKSRNNSIPWP